MQFPNNFFLSLMIMRTVTILVRAEIILTIEFSEFTGPTATTGGGAFE